VVGLPLSGCSKPFWVGLPSSVFICYVCWLPARLPGGGAQAAILAERARRARIPAVWQLIKDNVLTHRKRKAGVSEQCYDSLRCRYCSVVASQTDLESRCVGRICSSLVEWL
jgi:hypothetical protein